MKTLLAWLRSLFPRPELVVSDACVRHHVAHAYSRGEDGVCWRWPVQR